MFEKILNWFRKTRHQRRVEEMMKLAGQPIPKQPTFPPANIRLARAKLVLEEALELVDALGVDIKASLPDPTNNSINLQIPVQFRDLVFSIRPNHSVQLSEIAKEAADCSVVTIGTLSAFGISDSSILKAVDYNNLDKFGPGGYLDQNGKWIKPPNHRKPDIKHELQLQGWKP